MKNNKCLIILSLIGFILATIIISFIHLEKRIDLVEDENIKLEILDSQIQDLDNRIIYLEKEIERFQDY